MSNPTSLELRLMTRNVVCVESYWDEEHEIPWNFVQRSGDGRFDATVTIINETEKTCEQLSLGVFDKLDDARTAVHNYLRCAEELRAMRSQTFKQAIDAYKKT